ncbi:crotonase [Desulfosarcina widdelii]|uniref:Crotonase n=1 Tax=Desulfosarcina widdelii TaxID=947919 RepID=A0A5K7ZEJ3_9BACT|nr:enoyl-CoA hydratase-related protein [Desulfosarcina widdelii]BBO74627.1 crotonase [Desulfosarcina widdelii]
MNLNTLNYEKKQKIVLIGINRPKYMNALNSEVIAELGQAFDHVAADEDASVVIIHGGEKAFAAGADIKEISNLSTPVEAHRFVSRVHHLFNKIENFEKPVIAAVSGVALGGGCELILSCDIRIAAENAFFGVPEINIGVIPGGGGTQRLPRLIGIGRAKELIYSGIPIDAKEAHRIGLVNKVVPVEELLDSTEAIAAKYANQPAFALKVAKMAVNDGINMDLGSALSYEQRCFELLFSTEDQKEGMRAFIEKRSPVFSGK